MNVPKTAKERWGMHLWNRWATGRERVPADRRGVFTFHVKKIGKSENHIVIGIVDADYVSVDGPHGTRGSPIWASVHTPPTKAKASLSIAGKETFRELNPIAQEGSKIEMITTPDHHHGKLNIEYRIDDKPLHYWGRIFGEFAVDWRNYVPLVCLGAVGTKLQIEPWRPAHSRDEHRWKDGQTRVVHDNPGAQTFSASSRTPAHASANASSSASASASASASSSASSSDRLCFTVEFR